MHPQDYLTKKKEREHYLTHNNDVNDIRYQKFVKPVIDAVMSYTQSYHQGIDYGAGTGPVITKILHDKGYSMTTFDPFFISNFKALGITYDFIVCCEVVEHFHYPKQEFTQFQRLLNHNGLLIIKTELVYPDIDFPNWYYAYDPTHTIFYSPVGIRLLLNKNGFKSLELSPRLVIAKKHT